MNQSSVRQESDLCQYKPKCDVIVNATAYAPGGKPSKRFEVGLHIQRPSTPSPLPEMPRGLNPLQGPTHQQMEVWRNEVRQAQRTPLPGEILLNKKLIVTGERHFKKWIWPFPQLMTLLNWVSLGLIHIAPWRLTSPKPAKSVPIRAEVAFGGQCRVNMNEKAAKRVRKKYRLTSEQASEYYDTELPPDQRVLAHTAFEANLIGRGFAEQWYVNANKLTQILAPQIAYLDAPLSRRQFVRSLLRKLSDQSTRKMVAGSRRQMNFM